MCVYGGDSRRVYNSIVCTYLLNVMPCIYPGCRSLVSYVQEFMWGGRGEGGEKGRGTTSSVLESRM